jgi:hypothetical protein
VHRCPSAGSPWFDWLALCGFALFELRLDGRPMKEALIFSGKELIWVGEYEISEVVLGQRSCFN